MRKFPVILIIVIFLLNINIAYSDTFHYPQDEPVFSVYFPDNWMIETEDELLQAAPKDESIYIGIWALDGASDFETAFDLLADEIDQFVSVLEVEDPQELKINNLNVFVIDGKGKVDGINVEMSVTVFSPNGETFFIGLYFGTPEAIKNHNDELMEIIGSIEGIEATGYSNTFQYPQNNPVFSVDFPDNWIVETEDELLHAGPKDESIYIGIWALDGANDFETAFDLLADEIDQFVSVLEVEDPQELKINNLNVFVIDGKGKVDGINVEMSVTVFSPDGETFFIGLYFGTPESIKEHTDELMSIIGSLEGIE